MQKVIRKFIQWLLAPDLKDCRDEISARNQQSLYLYPGICIVIIALNILNQCDGSLLPAVIINEVLVCFVAALFCWLLVRSQKGRRPFHHATALLYLFETPVMLVALFTNTVLDSESWALSYLLFLTTMPILILDVPWHVLLDLFFWTAVFIPCCYVSKPSDVFHSDMIHLSLCFVCALLALCVVLTSRLEEVRSYHRLLYVDRLDDETGLFNRKYFLERAAQCVQRDSLYGNAYILYYDFTGMRAFNAEYGFPAGDALLSAFAKILKGVFPGDLAARFGEDHFVILTKGNAWESVGDRIIDALNDYFVSAYGRKLTTDAVSDFDPYHDQDDNTIHLSLRSGVCLVDRKISVNTACDRAREVCHSRDFDHTYSVRVYDETYKEEVENENYVLSHIDTALRTGRIRVYYQPVARAMTEQICGEEALARWDDPKIGIFAPYKFIPVLEQHKQLYKVDLFMAEQVLKDFAVKQAAGLALVPVSINLSRNDFDGRDMPHLIAALCEKYHCPHNLLDIEITESAYTADPERIDRAIDAFHALGFKVWMDDFGSGYSSLNMLQDTKFDLIKLDMRFLKDFDKKNELIISSILTMADRVGIDTLTEGVETKEEKDFLKAAGCGRLQGYYFDRPQPLDVVLKKRTGGDFFAYENPERTPYLETITRLDLTAPFAQFSSDTITGMQRALSCLVVEFKEEGKEKEEDGNKGPRKGGSLSLLRTVTDAAEGEKQMEEMREPILSAIPDCTATGHWVKRERSDEDSFQTLYLHLVSKDTSTGSMAILVSAIRTERHS